MLRFSQHKCRKLSFLRQKGCLKTCSSCKKRRIFRVYMCHTWGLRIEDEEWGIRTAFYFMRLASHSPFKASKILNNRKTNCHKLLARLVQDVPAWFSPSLSSRISVERCPDRQERGGGVGRRGGEESGGNSQQSQFRAALHLAPAVHLPPLDRFQRSKPQRAPPSNNRLILLVGRE